RIPERHHQLPPIIRVIGQGLRARGVFPIEASPTHDKRAGRRRYLGHAFSVALRRPALAARVVTRLNRARRDSRAAYCLLCALDPPSSRINALAATEHLIRSFNSAACELALETHAPALIFNGHDKRN